MNKKERVTQLTDITNVDVNRINFSEPAKPDSHNNIRIYYSVDNPDGTVGDLMVSTVQNLYCFGFRENFYNGKPDGWQFPISLVDRENPSQEQKDWIEGLNRIIERGKNHLVTNRSTLPVDNDLSLSDLRKVHPIRKTNKEGNAVDPVLNLKVIKSKKSDTFVTKFYDARTGDVLDPYEIAGKPCKVTAVVKIESIFIGSKISFQLKLYEAVVSMMDSNRQSFLRPQAQGRIGTGQAVTMNEMEENEDATSDTGSIEVEDERPKPKPVVTKVRRTVKLVKKPE